MTNLSDGTQRLALQGSPGRMPIWLPILLFGPATIAIIAGLVIALLHSGRALPTLLAGAFALVVSALAMFWIQRMLRRISVALDRDALVVDTGVAARRFPLSALRAAGVRIVNLREHVELQPILRTWGIGMPGLASGWFRLRNGGKALCIVTGRERVTTLRTEDGTWVLLSLADTASLRAAIESQ
jgi:hypothetical protein